MGQFDRACYEAWTGCQAQQRLKLEAAIRDSYENPESFWKDLSALHLEVTGLKTESLSLNRYHLYHDCILRHLGKRRIAFKCAKDGMFNSWTFEQLDRLVNFQYDRWIHAEIASDVHIAIVMPVGIHFLVTLLTALRLGLKFTFLPLDSPVLSAKRIWKYLDQINPDLIMTTSDDAAFINQAGDSVRSKFDKATLFTGGQREKCRYWLIDYLEEKGEAKEKGRESGFGDEIAQIALVSQSLKMGELRSLTKAELYRSWLRDGGLILGLKPGMTWAYSSYCPLREQPCALLNALFHGATTLYFTDKDLQQNPQLIENEPIDLLHLSSQMKDLMFEGKGFPKHKLKLCTRSIFHHDDERSWDLFKEKCKLEKTPFTRIYWDNAQAGITLFSLPSIEKYETGLWPSLGIPWKLSQSNALQEQSLDPFGILQQLPPEASWAHYSDSNLIVTMLNHGCFVASTRTSTKDGYPFPVAEIEEAVSLLEFVDKSILLNLRRSGGAFHAKQVLILFVKSKYAAEIEKHKKGWTLQVVMLVKDLFGALFVPDLVEFYPFSPKLEGEGVDRSWCELQYTNGLFARKRGMKVYELLHHLRTMIKEGV